MHIRLLQNALIHVFIIVYLLVLLAGFLFSVLRYRLPLVPEPLHQLSYQAMAPYQNYSTYNFDLAAEGLSSSGEWEPINLDPYYPYAAGERFVRIQMASFAVRGEEVLQATYQKRAEQIRRREEIAGRPYERVRLWNERWPASPEGLSSLRHSPFLERSLITETP